MMPKTCMINHAIQRRLNVVKTLLPSRNQGHC